MSRRNRHVSEAASVYEYSAVGHKLSKAPEKVEVKLYEFLHSLTIPQLKQFQTLLIFARELRDMSPEALEEFNATTDASV